MRSEARSPESEPVESALESRRDWRDRLDEAVAFEAREGGIDRSEGDIGPNSEAVAQLSRIS